MTPSWSPFLVEHGALIAPRPLRTPEGVGDRLRTAAFAEVQAEAAFEWAASRFGDAPDELRRAWLTLAAEERKHRDWLLARMDALGARVDERPVSDVLWHSLVACANAREFCHYMAGAEERGRRAGERFGQTLQAYDEASAAIFARIAVEERAHIALAYRFFAPD